LKFLDTLPLFPVLMVREEKKIYNKY
jgi:hypothetical protein